MAHLIPSLLLLTGLAGCATAPPHPPETIANIDMTLPRKFPACAAEIKAFVALSRLAKQMGEAAPVLAPQLDAMQDEVMDCLADSYPNPMPI